VANRLQQALTREAVSLIQKGIVTAKDLDTIVTTSFALRLIFTGPIEQKDLNGIDTYVSVAKLVGPDLEDAKEPLALVKAMVAAGELGVKTGTGFYDWTGKSPIEIYNKKNKELLDLLAFLNKRQIHS
jgi:3-hydroxybutyryl-CoA dehydrogenase